MNNFFQNNLWNSIHNTVTAIKHVARFNVQIGHCIAPHCLLGFNELIVGAQNKTIFSIKWIRVSWLFTFARIFCSITWEASVCANDCVLLNILDPRGAERYNLTFTIRLLVAFFSVLTAWYRLFFVLKSSRKTLSQRGQFRNFTHSNENSGYLLQSYRIV